MSESSPPPSADSFRLKKTLGPASLWGLGVGYVISGEYFGWNLGLPVGGTYGLLAAFVVVTLMYVAFVFSYTEMACAIPRAGGVFVYGVRGLGLMGGYLGGVAQVVEFVFAPPAIAVALGAYVATVWEGVDPKAVACTAYVVFTLLNIWGVRQAAVFELAITILAVGELLLFTCLTAPHFRWEAFSANPLPHGWGGAIAALPFAIWFYLAIEGVANAAEEAKNPRRDVALGFGSAILTLVVLATFVLFFAIGVGGWERIVYESKYITTSADGTLVVDSAAPTSDKPLPLALGQIYDRSHVLYHLLVGVGAFGLIASLNGIILVAGRALFEMGRVGFLPRFVGMANHRTHTPAAALLVNMVVGLASICFLDAGKLITMAAMGAVTLYILSMLALLRLRRVEPNLARPYRTPFYPVFPWIVVVIASFSLALMAYENWNNVAAAYESITLWYVSFLAAAFAYYGLFVRGKISPADVAHFHRLDADE
jgi:ethanolamine permease